MLRGLTHLDPHPFMFFLRLILALLITGRLIAQVQVADATPVASRLSTMVIDQPAAPGTPAPAPASRLGTMLLAQIPQQPNPGQNPNTIRPITPVNPKLPVNRGVAGSAARPLSPSPTPPAPVGASKPVQPAPPAPPPGSPVAKPGAPAPASTPDGSATEGGDDELIELQYINVPMPQILLLYEDLTGKKIIRDINVEAVTFTLETTGKLPKKKAIEYIEKSLLLNGYGFIPSGEDMVKFINFAAIKPGPEHPLIFDADKLPQNGEEICTYVHSLNYIDPEDLKKSLTDLVPLHNYGVLSPLPNSRGIVITENSNTIRYILELLKHLDVEPSRTEKRSFQLTRSSAEDVAKALADILDLEGKGKTSGSGGGKVASTPAQPTNPNPAGIPNQPGAAAAQPRTSGVYGAAPQASAAPPKLVPIPRTNKLMVIARPVDLEYIASLIDELDGAAEIRNFTARKLNYLQASEALSILGDALARISDESGGSAGGSKSGGNPIGTTANNTNQRTGDFGSSGGNRSGMGGGGFGSSYGGGMGGGGSSFGSGGGLQSKRQAGPPTSLVMGKSLLIADPTQNSIFASGPPEHLETVNQIIDALDVRPQQVFLSVVIGQLKLTENHDFGIDYLFGPTEIANGKYSGMGAGTIKNRVGANQNILDPSALKGVSDLASKMPTGISLYGTIYDNVNVVISALDSNSNFKVLSRPSVFTLNNEPASIETGQQIPVPASTYSSYNPNLGTGVNDGTTNSGQFSTGFQSNIQYMDVSLRLDVVPVINSDEDITLQIKQVNKERGDSIAISGNNIPSIINQGLETTVITKTNATVLLGGLIREDHSKKESGVPILRHIPIVKKLFSSTEDTTSRSELLIFIQPRIVNGNNDLPNTAWDAPGASPLGEEIRSFMDQEHKDPKADEKSVKRTKIGALIRKLFN